MLLDDDHGPVAVHGLPYLDPDHLRAAWGLPGRSHQATLTEAMRRVRADLATRPRGTRSVVMAHAFVAGHQEPRPSDSERDISVGGVQLVPTTVFDGVDYVALGHLHGRHDADRDGALLPAPRSRTRSPRPTSTRAPGWSTSTPDGQVTTAFVDAPVPVRSRGCAARSTRC